MLTILTISALALFIAVFSFYAVLVIYTFIRALDFKVRLRGLSSFKIPIDLILMHIKMYNELKRHDKKKAKKILIFVFTNYPVALTRLMVIICQEIAEIKVLGTTKGNMIVIKNDKVNQKQKNGVVFNNMNNNSRYKEGNLAF